MPTGDQALSAIIRKAIAERGPVSFAWFMEQALYHPQFGYYSSGACEIGRRGDYFTNVSVGPLFGGILAAQFAEMWELLERPRPFTIVEQGAHEGDFARDVLEALRARAPEFFAAVRYCIVEPFPVLRGRQEARLRELGDRVTWTKSLADLEPFIGVHFSNELLDAMPVRLVSREEADTEWNERLVDWADGGFAFVEAGIADEELRRQVENLPRSDRGRYETEVNLAALEWVRELSGKLDRGFILAVDYGFSRADFFAPERVAGTLQCRANHHLISSPLTEVGRADITSHVDWTSITEVAEQQGLALAGFTDQHHFITGLLDKFAVEETQRRGLQTLIHPELLGTRFQYLALAKNAPHGSLSGFRFARDSRQALGV